MRIAVLVGLYKLAVTGWTVCSISTPHLHASVGMTTFLGMH